MKAAREREDLGRGQAVGRGVGRHLPGGDHRQRPRQVERVHELRDRQVVLAETPRVQIETPRLRGSINLKGARIDDLVLFNSWLDARAADVTPDAGTAPAGPIGGAAGESVAVRGAAAAIRAVAGGAGAARRAAQLPGRASPRAFCRGTERVDRAGVIFLGDVGLRPQKPSGG